MTDKQILQYYIYIDRKFNHVSIHLIEKLLGIPLMFQFYNMSPDKFASFILLRKMKTKGATRSQSCPSNVAYLMEKVYVVLFSKTQRGAINVFLYQKSN